jgi:hypothetical protein
MNDHNDAHPPEVDPFEVAAESLLYGDPAVAKEKLKDAILHGAAAMHAHQTRQGIIDREAASSQEVAQRFSQENPEWANDPMIRDAVKAGMRVEQLNDLLKAGLDLGKIADATGRVPTENEIFNMHRDLRAVGNPNMRTPEQLFEDVSSQIEGKFNIKRRLKDIEHNRKRAIRDMQKQRGTSQWGDGLAPDDQPTASISPRRVGVPTDGDSAVRDHDRWAMGMDADTAVDAQMHQSRKNAIADRMERNFARDRNVRFSKEPSDYKHADRRQAG